MGKGIFDYIAPIVETAALTAIGQPELAPFAIGATEGIKTGVETGSPWKGLESGALAGGGAYIGGQALGGLGGTLGETPANALGSTFGGDTVGSIAPFGSFAGNVLGSGTIGSSIGSSLGQGIGTQAFNALNPASQAPSSDIGGITPFSPSQQPQMGIPQSLSQFSGLSPLQQGTNIATKGVYGGGNGPQENQYFMNLVNRSLFDNGQVAANSNNINPVEMGYLNQLGVSGSSPTDLLKGISQYGT